MTNPILSIICKCLITRHLQFIWCPLLWLCIHHKYKSSHHTLHLQEMASWKVSWCTSENYLCHLSQYRSQTCKLENISCKLVGYWFKHITWFAWLRSTSYEHTVHRCSPFRFEKTVSKYIDNATIWNCLSFIRR